MLTVSFVPACKHFSFRLALVKLFLVTTAVKASCALRLWVLCCTLVCSGAAAQTFNEDAEVYFGFAGELVADAWNPLRVTLRDAPPAELVLELDVGTLRRGPVAFRYTAELSGGRGVYTFEDDVYLPAWRAFSWLIRTPDEVLASGTLPRYLADTAPLNLVQGREAGAGTRFFKDGARVVDVTAADLPERAAAYSGVESVLLLPQTAPPTPAAVAAAGAAGSTVMLGGRLGAAYSDVSALVPRANTPLGTGTLSRLAEVNRGSVQGALQTQARFVPDTLAGALTGDDLTRAPTGQSSAWLALRVGAYALLLLLLLRFGGGPGVVAALLLAGLLSFVAWRTRPAEPLLLRDRSLVLSRGALGLRTNLHYLFSFPGGAADVPYAAHPLPVTGVSRYGSGPESTGVTLPTYGSALLVGKPHLEPAVLRWNGERVFNSGPDPLTDVFVTWGGSSATGGAAPQIGTVSRGGQQAELAPGETLPIKPGSLTLPEVYKDLEPQLPPGSVLARDGGTVYVLLPEPTN